MGKHVIIMYSLDICDLTFNPANWQTQNRDLSYDFCDYLTW